MFRSIYHERKNPLQGMVILTIILVSVVLLIFLHANIAGDIAQRSKLPILKIETETDRSPAADPLYRPSIKDQKARRLPQAIIIGSRKSGTRALLKFLEVNPAIRPAHSEVHFFDKPQNYKLGFNWYRSQMPLSTIDDITIEKSPAYFVTQGVPERIKAMNSSIKLVLILRDPVTRLISDYSQLVANKIEVSEDDEDGDYGEERYSEFGHISNNNNNNNLTKSVWDKAGKDFEKYVLRPDGGIDDQRRAVKIGMYSIYLERWRAFFPIKQFHFVDGEALISNPYEELHKLELFLDLKPTIRPENFLFNPRKGFYCLATNSILPGREESNKEPSNQTAQSVNDLMSAKSNNETSIQISTTTTTNCLSKSKGRKHVTVRKDLIEELQKFYEPYNEYLYSLTGQNFNWSRIKILFIVIMSPHSRWLRLMVFDLDCTLWPFHVDMFTYTPPFNKKNGQVVDAHGQKMEHYPEALEILEHWSKKCEIAVASRTSFPQGAESLLNLFGFDKYIKYKEIYPGCKHTHFARLKKQSTFDYSEMLFFDDEPRNIRDLRQVGVESVLVDSDVGVTKKLIEEAVAKKFQDAKLV